MYEDMLYNWISFIQERSGMSDAVQDQNHGSYKFSFLTFATNSLISSENYLFFLDFIYFW